MDIQIEDQAVPPVKLTERGSASQDSVTNKHQSFSASLCERKTPLVLGDSLLVGLAAFGALLLWRAFFEMNSHLPLKRYKAFLG